MNWRIVFTAKKPMSDHPKPKPHKRANTEVEALKTQVEQLAEALKRERADAINLRRRHEQELTSLRNRVKSSVVYELLPPLDNLERSLAHVPKELEGNSYVEGVENILKQFEKTLSSMGVEKIKTVGEPFNPELHEAISFEDGKGTEQIVSEELQPGYTLNGQVIRHAMVKVSSK
ncbi:MAG TPA: nucleotide exchange factor GrpE [Candidatus Sulfotelmatobacter sp.]|nr:nucleotide exchange factor GrpE [Candidatus Sulfotelmatobacter sp.]